MNILQSDEGDIVINPKDIGNINDKPEVILSLSMFEIEYELQAPRTLQPPQPGKDARQHLWHKRRRK